MTFVRPTQAGQINNIRSIIPKELTEHGHNCRIDNTDNNNNNNNLKRKNKLIVQ